MEYVVDTYTLRVRLAIDGRTMGLIAKDAKMPPETIKEVLASGKAERDVIEKIRLAVKPTMRFNTICPKSLQAKSNPGDKEPKSTRPSPEDIIKVLGDDIKRDIELSNKISALCEEYSAIEVFSIISEWQDHILSYIQESGFDLLELLDESMTDRAGSFYLDEKSEVRYRENGRKES